MGTGLSFKTPERAAFAAAVLIWCGHGALWRKDRPCAVMTSAPQSEARRIIDEHPGSFPNWRDLPDMDEGTLRDARAWCERERRLEVQ